MGEARDYIVVSWNISPSGRGAGFCRPIGDANGDQRNSLYLREEQFITFGSVHVGSRIKCQVGPSSEGFVRRSAVQVEIYIE